MWAFLHLARTQIAARGTPVPDTLENRYLELARLSAADLKLDFSRSISEPLKQWLPPRTDGVAQPLWPWLTSWLGVTSPGAEPSRNIQSASWLQAGLCLGFLLALGLLCGRSFCLPAALLVMLSVAFAGMLPTVGRFTGDTLFDILFLLTWITCIYGMQRNSLWVYGLAGALGALAYLTDDRALPLLVVFAFVSSLRAFWEWLAGHWPRQFGGRTTLWVPRNHILGGLLMVTLFFFVSGPRLSEAYHKFHSPFFHARNQLHWLDSAAEAEAWIKTELPLQEKVGASAPQRLNWTTYLQTHSRPEVWQRLGNGIAAVLREFAEEGGAVIGALAFILLTMALAMPFATPKAQHAGQRLHPETVPAVVLVVLAVAVYVAIAGWDAAVLGTAGQLRLLAPPVVLGLVWGCESLHRRARRRQASPLFLWTYQGALWTLAAFESWQVIQQLQAGPTTL